MSKGVYTILASNIGKQDNYITATERLKRRLLTIKNKNILSGNFEHEREAMPTLTDIESTHNLFIKNKFKPHVALAFEYEKTNHSGKVQNTTESQNITFDINNNNGNFISDMVIHVKLSDIGDSTAAVDSWPRYRYTSFPGARLFENISLVIDRKKVDEYTHLDMVFHSKVNVGSSDESGWSEMLGQESKYEGEYYHRDFAIRQLFKYTDGAQTLRVWQEGLDLWIPLIFDFNKFASRALHNQLVGTLQKHIEIKTASLGNIIRGENADGSAASISGFHIEKAELYTRNIYLPPDVNDIFINTTHLSLIRVFKHHREIIKNSSDDLLLSQLKHPIEIIYFGFRPLENDTSQDSFDVWHKFSKRETAEAPIPVLIKNGLVNPVLQLVSRTANYYKTTAPARTIGFKAHDNVLYNNLNDKFYNLYMDYILPGISTPGESGIYTVSFCLYPIGFNPSGHVNNSIARELYINYDLHYTPESMPVEIYCSAQCLNMIIYDKYTFKLKYAT